MNKRILQGPELKYHIKEKTLGEFFFNTCEKYSDCICQIDGTTDQVETYSSVKLRSIRLALKLQKMGITSEDVITICSANNMDNIIPIVATAFLGAKVSNAEASLSVRHTKHLLSLVTPKVLFVDEPSINLIEESLVDATFQVQIVVFGKSDKYTVFSDLVKPQEDEDKFTLAKIDPDSISVIFFSSGSTGLPKAICHSQSSVLQFMCCTYQAGLQNAALHFTTFYWITATIVLGCSFIGGSYRVFLHGTKASEIFRIIEKYKVVSIFSSPILTYKFTSYENSEAYDTSSLKILICSGTVMTAEQLLKLRSLFKSAFVSVGYGMSENGFATAFQFDLDQEYAKSKLLSCGKPVANLKLKITDVETGKLLGPNEKGEICVFSPCLMKGYYKADSSSAFDQEGFLKSGDVGYYDKDGFVYVIERIKEMFKYQSWHIVPSLIEGVLLEHPFVKEVVVFGIPKDEEGEVPAACVTLKENCTLTEKEVDEFLKTRVADRERLRGGVTIVKNLPMTPSGKVIRNEVREFVLKSKSM